ncbi:MAG: TrpR YerC/YecD [Ruminococcaceae bacterium]|nr:TrpR YerC/YecD [Oscillospiraceae bacterium]
MTPSEKKTAELFYEAILSLDNDVECADFFKDVCTTKELLSIAQRYMVAKMLRERRVYSDIVKETGASTATVSRVKRMMSDGTGAVNKILERTNK